MPWFRSAGWQARGGQGPIVHLEADLHASVEWARQQGKRWAFTSSNAGSRYFEDWSDLGRLNEIDWDAVQARSWSACKEKKQAEFLLEHSFPWDLIERIAVESQAIIGQAMHALPPNGHRPAVEIQRDWYY